MLQVRDRDVLTQSEYVLLCRAMPRTATGGGALAAMAVGVPVAPIEAYTALDLSRLDRPGDEAVSIIDRGLSRLRAAFPGEVPA